MSSKKKFACIALLIGCAGAMLISWVTLSQIQRHLSDKLIVDVTQLGTKIDSQLERYSQLPDVLASDPRLLPPLLASRNPTPTASEQSQAVNQLLAQWSQTLGADTLYLIDMNGTTLASSNWQQPDSFVGQNFSYRPYFQQAATGQRGQYFALGARSDKRGYYFSAPVTVNRQPVGVLTIKVDLSLLTDIWQHDDIEYAITDRLGIIFYSSEPQWLYHSLTPLDETTKQRINQSRQYGHVDIAALTQAESLMALNQQPVTLYGATATTSHTYINAQHDMEKAGWYIFGFTPQTKAFEYMGQVLLLFVLIYSLLCVAVHSWWQTYRARIDLANLNSRLERRVSQRTRRLQETNQQLKIILSQYEHSQAELKQTQDELLQAAKLAMLGELSASINHEINQPLAAIRTYAENGRKLLEKQRYDTVSGNLDEIIQLNQLITDIIARFKIFARKRNLRQASPRTNAGDSIRSALSLMHTALIKQGIVLRLEDFPDKVIINIDAVQFEQVLVNLLQNSLQALKDQAEPQVGITLTVHSGHAECRVWDNGPGLSQEQKEQVFSPFYTTKADGLGLGMTISKRIIDAYHGTLSVSDHLGGGAEFTLCLPLESESTP
ncbi:ATP-binding protein [Photobacterium lutimaris]|uniref:C4-dicarboxylate transport sensor protein DctB n=1 Tax=Photobacterium lutimaris TaxID=388278 RepID=A0A2T3IYR4_9GAMM|nr:ATP-binding protein [Photobacterium lutimaris]PSU33737.1 sensor histidine kinase [Photobacterium lutimaris]TDR74560.1 signal transduction histidine kinase [Photobacterium lutimaris]